MGMDRLRRSMGTIAAEWGPTGPSDRCEVDTEESGAQVYEVPRAVTCSAVRWDILHADIPKDGRLL